jgi:Tfp pilus assembly protein PilO
MDWALNIDIIIQLLGLASLAGVGWTKISVLEKDLNRVEQEVIDSRELRSQLAIVQTQLHSIHQALESLSRQITKQDVR